MLNALQKLPVLLAALLSCTPATSPLEQYVAGAVDAVHQAAPQKMPDIYVSWEPNEKMGGCRTVEGKRVIYLYAEAILRQASSVQHARDLIRQTLVHELAHAALQCADADHGVMP